MVVYRNADQLNLSCNRKGFTQIADKSDIVSINASYVGKFKITSRTKRYNLSETCRIGLVDRGAFHLYQKNAIAHCKTIGTRDRYAIWGHVGDRSINIDDTANRLRFHMRCNGEKGNQ
ncbi:MAG: hypothetical protein EB003_06445 [Flavobacteriia bacterium]|nr:hypothetical protein [Flavobacteriia bacterium]